MATQSNFENRGDDLAIGQLVPYSFTFRNNGTVGSKLGIILGALNIDQGRNDGVGVIEYLVVSSDSRLERIRGFDIDYVGLLSILDTVPSLV